MALDTTSLAALLEALRSWLIDNPDGDIQEFADEHNVDVADLADGWHAYFAQADFGRNYDLGADTTQAGAQSAVQSAPVYTPSEPPPYGSSPEVYHEYLTQEVNNFQEFTTVNNITNNIEDNSFNQQIIGSKVQQEIDIDNSDVTQGDGSVNIDDSILTESPINTGDLDDGSVLPAATATRPTPATSAPPTAARPPCSATPPPPAAATTTSATGRTSPPPRSATATRRP